MYGYNIHSGMPMHGGLTGHGMHSLGGYLLGGAKVSDMNNAQLAAYKLARGQKKALARNNLKEQIAAERWAAQAAMDSGHQDYEEYLTRDYIQEQKILDQKRMPMWAANQYSYNTLYQPRVGLSAEQKYKNKKYKQIIKQMRGDKLIAGPTKRPDPTITNPKTGREVSINSTIGKRILKARDVLSGNIFKRVIAPSRGQTLYSNADERELNRPLTNRERSNLNLDYGPIVRASRAGMAAEDFDAANFEEL